ncbi:MAG: hypothetical protein DRR42_24395 [Gammaproteobacteria bacterium]|nr:MAG: hypothetical protein DRR42_24395 [Gammaproteobacteria bacterium]
MDDLLEYKNEIFNYASVDADANELFPEESFFEYVSELLGDAGILDNVEYCPYRNSNKGMKIDGYSWNPLEKTICGIIVNFTNEPDLINTLTNTKIGDIGKRVARFFENIENEKFLSSLEVTDPGRLAALDLAEYLEEAIKFRIVVFTDQVLSARVKKLDIGSILNRDTSIEIWDLERLKNLDQSGADHEEFTVDVKSLGGGIKALPANEIEGGVSTYLGIMPGTLLSAIYDEFGQRLLESNVRTFLDFRAATNKGMRKTLVTEPENFFAYNNGITITATGIKTEIVDGQLVIIELDNLQIVNGGQTTASIYFSPREKGGIKGADREYSYRDIDLSKVFIQMKLTVVGEKEIADVLKSKIATFANSQNSIQQSDLVSNHPFHLNIESRSRKQLMPAGESGLPTKWFYERARGQYSTQLRALSSKQRRKFEVEYPKKQMFSKTDMAKYENTWRMKPFFVKKGAQANLKLLGAVIIGEFEKSENDFGAVFYKDLVAKMILFRQSDSAILRSDWYKAEKGFKAEAVTYTLALLRHSLLEKGKDINLTRIYQNQSVSDNLMAFIVSLAKLVRNNITDPSFRGGVANPSEFCKSEKGWLRFLKMNVDLSGIERADIIDGEQKDEQKKESKEIGKALKSINHFEYVMKVKPAEWQAVADYFDPAYGPGHANVGIPTQCVALHTQGKVPSDKQLKMAVDIREKAYADGFDFVS